MSIEASSAEEFGGYSPDLAKLEGHVHGVERL